MHIYTCTLLEKDARRDQKMTVSSCSMCTILARMQARGVLAARMQALSCRESCCVRMHRGDCMAVDVAGRAGQAACPAVEL